MTKWVNTNALDAALNYIKQATSISVTSTQPLTQAEAATTYRLAITTASIAAISAGTGTSARKVVVNAHNTITVDTTATAQHVALLSANTLYYVTTCTPQGLVATNTVTIPTWNIEFSDPT
jgi:hypothetical protein